MSKESTVKFSVNPEFQKALDIASSPVRVISDYYLQAALSAAWEMGRDAAALAGYKVCPLISQLEAWGGLTPPEALLSEIMGRKNAQLRTAEQTAPKA